MNELSFSELIEKAKNKLEAASSCLENIGESFNNYGKKIDVISEEMIKATSVIQKEKIVVSIEPFLNEFAIGVNDLASKMEIDNTLFIENYRSGFNAYLKLVSINDENFSVNNIDKIINAKDMLINLEMAVSRLLNSSNKLNLTITMIPKYNEAVEKATGNLSTQLSNNIKALNEYSRLGLEVMEKLSFKIDSLDKSGN